MYVVQFLILLCFIYLGNAGYGIPAPSDQYGQSDVQAPAYMPPYLKTHSYSTKTASGGGTKTSYSSSKSYFSRKSSFSGTKNSYSGTKTAYSGTKTGHPSKYAESQSWYSSSNNAPSYYEFHNSANEVYAPKCTPECKNTGICVDTNTCQCPANYYGKHCEFEKKPCLSYPPMPEKSNRMCSPELCTFTCIEGHKFIDGSTVANMNCVEGQWQPTRADFTTLPDCQPECSPACMNGGVCLSVNVCECPEAFRGPQCQYSTSVCDIRKLAFNGAYTCKGDSDSFSCSLTCPSGSTYSSPPAEMYTCLYSTGVFQPQPIPHCIFPDIVIVTPGRHSHNITYYTHTSESEGREVISSSSHTHKVISESASGYYDTKSPVTLVVQDLTPKGGTCLTWAGVHYKTFDGKIYSFQTPCQHILVRDARDHKYSVNVKHGDCKDRLYCPSELTFVLDEKFYTLSVGEDGSIQFRSTKRLIPLPAVLPGVRVTLSSDRVLVQLDVLGVTVQWDTNNMILVQSSVLQWNNTEGLCGTLDGNPENDLKTDTGAIAKTKTVFASAWQIRKVGDLCDGSPTEAVPCTSKSADDVKKAQQFCASIFSMKKFQKCSKVMDVTMLLEACQWDYCACTASLSPEECACETVSVYAKECHRHGIEEMKNWRDPDTCPMKCPEGKLYNSCGPDSQPSCAYPLLPISTSNTTTCVEGCFCPEGLLLDSGKCVPPAECPCRLRNKNFKPGAKIKRDCNTCTCEWGTWTCSKAACGARCGAVGDPHYTTFDGLKYDFMGHCTYTMLATDNFTVDVENVACSGAITEAMNLGAYTGEGKPSCTKAISLIYHKHNIQLKQGGLILVDGSEVSSLPVMVGDVRVRAASSLFIIVQLPNKVDLWWDGNTRVFIDVPPEFKGKTKGLCGTFNLNQKDDFLTPENDIEQSALAFANKWKTREVCADISTKEPEHPCKANIENKATAEMFCSKLKSKVFEACHWHVDVSPYYEACVYDMCACGADVTRCLCAVLGDYAAECARRDVMLQWRYHVQECELQCTGGQEYTVCADSCLRKCSDTRFASSGECKAACVEGCACPQGQLLDDSGMCVPHAMCPCHHKGMEFKPGYKEVRAGRRERELCTCVGASWDCIPATPADIKQYPPAEDLRSNCSATANMEFTTCEIAEPITCKNMHLPLTSTTAECRPGCQCKKGYVLDTRSKTCIAPTQCPCHHGGTSYPDGYMMQEECNKCECKSGNWTCTQKKCAGVCSAWGDSHIVTFDGTDYDFMGVCTYLLAKGAMDENDGFDVEIQNEACGTTGATCSKSVTLRASGETVSLTKNAPIPNMSGYKRIKLREAGSFVFLDVPTLGVTLEWDRGMRVYVKVQPIWQGRVKGLCGNYNDDRRDDFLTPTSGGIPETSALIFADSWKQKATCPKAQAEVDHCTQRPERKEWSRNMCSVLKRAPFTLCHVEVGVSPYIARCTRDVCACDSGDDCACACTALAEYAHACKLRGVMLKWRTNDLCPMQCDEECSNYEPCISPCPIETCDNTLDYAELKGTCEQDTCVEGCKPKLTCPPGQVYTNSSHKECIPIAKCSPVCLEVAGKLLREGDVIEQDDCHTCTCSKRRRVCTGLPCTTVTPTDLTTPKVHDEPLKCISGWTDWINRGPPEIGPKGQSVDKEPLPKPNELTIGQPMCKENMMTKIECRSVKDHKTPKETGLDVECSLERGLICNEPEKDCLDFEIRVYCECEETPCTNSLRPNEPHPTDCSKFYECSPSGVVVKTCGPGTLYHAERMVCDWPYNVLIDRPECGESTTSTSTVSSTISTREPTPIPLTTPQCPPGQIYSDCAYPCNQLCHHFKKTLKTQGRCLAEKCVEGCIDKPCEEGSLWRDEQTCVLKKDCTCYKDGKIIKPGGVVSEGCVKCQCLENDIHCDASDCSSIEPTGNSTTTTTTSTPSTIRTTTVLVQECAPENYIDLMFGDQPLPSSSFSASSVASDLFAPQYAKLNGRPTSVSAGSWNPVTHDTNQYIQVTLPHREPIYGVVLQGSPLFDQFVTSYEVLYGDEEEDLQTVKGPDGKPKVFKGPEDSNTAEKQMIEPPIDAKIIRIHPLTWNEEIAIRFELIGCQEPKTTEKIVIITTPTSTVVPTTIPVTTTPFISTITPYTTPGLTITSTLSTSTITVPSSTVTTPVPTTVGFTPSTQGYTTSSTPVPTTLAPTTQSSTTPVTTTTQASTTPVTTTPILSTTQATVSTTIVAPLIMISTTSPPPDCNPNHLANLLWGDQPLPATSFSASSVASEMFAPQYAKLDGHPVDVSAGSWNPKTHDTNQYIQVTLPHREPIYGVILQGSPLFDQYITSYHVMYGDDGVSFSTVNDRDNKPRIFRGPVNNNSPLKQMLEPPIEAKVIRIQPLSWHNEIAVRFELVGCKEPLETTTFAITTPPPLECTDPIGLTSGLPIEDIEVSSNNDARQYFFLEGERGWRPLYSTPGEWIMFNFTGPRNITGIKTKGGPKGWVTTYKILYTSDLSTFNPILDSTGSDKLFPANFDSNTAVMNEFRPPIHAQYFKVLPISWKDTIEMRIEPIGCYEPYIIPEEPSERPREQVTPPPCTVCPNIQITESTCDCKPPMYYDGENCVTRDQCPCVESFMTYAVGSMFRGANCDECVCKLGGITDCKPARECKCVPDLVPKLMPSCECFCEPCPNGTKICPTSKLCLALDKWCDGLQDCPDDEKDCTTSTTSTTTTTVRTTVTEATVVTTVANTQAALVTTAKPPTCPKVECPRGYSIHYTSTSPPPARYTYGAGDLPPPRARRPYYRGAKGGAKGGSKGGYSKGGFTKTAGFSKGGYGGLPPRRNQAFTLDKPTITNPVPTKQECAQFKCVPKLPPYKPGQTGTTPAPVCSVVTCPDGYTLKFDKAASQHNKCPQYECVPPPERQVFCNMMGRTFNTFDGAEYKYDACFHILARENRFDAWAVLVRKKCRVEGCSNELLVIQDGQPIIVKPNLMIEYDNYEYTVEQTSKICFQKNSFDVDRLGDGVVIKSRKYNFTVLYTKEGDIKIGVYKSYMGSVDGLCGAFDGNPKNDRRLPNGRQARSIDEFGKAWAKPGLSPSACHTRVIPEEKQKRAWKLCEVIVKEPLSACSSVLNLNKWRSICLEKICECSEEVNGTRSEEECRCVVLQQLVAECLAADRDLDLAPWRLMMDCPAECPAPLVHYDCYRQKCSPTCSPYSVSRSCPGEGATCFPGCYCPAGTLRKGDTCILPTECADCTCTGVGTPSKYVTFEGDDLPNPSNCTYLVSQDTNTTGHLYQIFASNAPCEDNKEVICTKSVHLVYGSNVVHVTKDVVTKKLLTTIGNTAIYKYPLKKDWVTITQDNKKDVTITLPDLHVELTVLEAKLEFSVRVPSYVYANKTEGLCGVCAGYREDLVMSNGTVTEDVVEYTKSWQASPEALKLLDLADQGQCDQPPEPECVLPPADTNPCYNILNADKFGACHALVEPQSFVESCEADLCNNVTDTCASLQRYVAQCAAQGTCVHWRDHTCPYTCEAPLVYRACVDCEKTCDNYEELKNKPEKCTKRPVEGCFCPEGKVRVNNTCIEPTKCFPCDANKEHYAGDEWQEDACTKCTCSKLPTENTAHVTCTRQSCSEPLCAEGEDLRTTPPAPGHCCATYLCVPKPKANCTEAKKMECGFGQVLKQKKTADGCQEFACECKPESECEPLPSENEIEILEAGMLRVIDDSGCCPRVQFLCKVDTCPQPPQCEQFYTLKTNDVGKCCPEHKCELPKDKCLVKLEWEAAAKGGEKAKSTPQTVLKDVESVWLDGPCRSCRCESTPQGALPSCSLSECVSITSTAQLVVEPRPVPFQCCPVPVHVACRDGDDIYKEGENWTSSGNPCESYTCERNNEGGLERVTTVQTCHTDCQLGSKYFPASKDSGSCCGRCEPVACVCTGVERAVDSWWSPDSCTNCTCLNVNGSLQVQCANETCPEISDAVKKQFVLKEEKIEGKCCPKHEAVACRVGNLIYQEGQTWSSPDPCKNISCTRDVSGTLAQQESISTCVKDCKKGWAYVPPPADKCCGQCEQEACIVEDRLVKPGTTWQSPDKCTTYTCDKLGAEVQLMTSRRECPDVSRCPPDRLVNGTCCQLCEMPVDNLSKCVPKSIISTQSIGLLRIRLGPHGLCVNKIPLKGFKECRGSCDSGTLYNNQTGSHDTQCECCQASKYSPIVATLECEDGTKQLHRVASPSDCKCAACGEKPTWSKGGSSKTPAPSKGGYEAAFDEDSDIIPEIYQRFGPTPRL